jgi:glycosyltransferase involved in cell wall biosynthesis
MSGIVHIHPARCDFQTERCLEILKKDFARDWSVVSVSIGPGGDFGNLPAAIYRLRLARLNQTHIAHAWNETALAAAIGAGFLRIIFSPQAPIVPAWRPWIGAIVRHWEMEIACPTNYYRQYFIAQGAQAARCTVIFPAVDRARSATRDTNLRKKLGFSDTDCVLLAPGESTPEASHKLALWAAAILKVLDPRWRLLIWGRGAMLPSLERFVETTHLSNLMVSAEQRLGESILFESLPSAADLAFEFAQNAAPVLPVEICMASGLPIVASAAPDSRDFLQDGVNAIVQPDATPRILAQRVIALQKRPDFRAKIAAAAKAHAAELFSTDRSLRQWREIYARVQASNPQKPRIFAGDMLVELKAMHYI